MTVLRYSLMRLMLLFGCLLLWYLVLGLFGVHNVTVLVALTAVSSIALSFVLLRGPREQMAQQLADRVSGRLGPEQRERVDRDAADEDAEVGEAVSRAPGEPGGASRQGQGQAEQRAVGELGAPGVAQHGDERDA